jgi:hypothetical protein
MNCARCPNRSSSVAGGLIRGLCAECSAELQVKAKKRGIYLLVSKEAVLPPAQRERIVDGVMLWWWEGQWRIQ